MKICILSCSRSGSTYAVKFLNKTFNLRTGHERVNQDGGAGWKMLLEHLPCSRPLEEFDSVVHQVRHPLHVIKSLGTHDRGVWESISNMIPELPKEPLRRYMTYWIEWNRTCEQKSSLSYRVEDLCFENDLLMSEFESMLGQEAVKREINRKTNSRKGRKGYRPKLTWGELEIADENLARQTKELAQHYGYQV